MIKPNVTNPSSPQAIGRSTPRLMPRRIITMTCVATLAFLVLGVAGKVIENTTRTKTDQAATSGGATLPAKPSETVYLVKWLDPFNPEVGGRIQVVDPNTGGILKTIDTGSVPDIAISPDGQRLYLAAIEYESGGKAVWNDYLTAFDMKTWKTLWRTEIESPPDTNGRATTRGSGPSALTPSPDGSRLFIKKQAGWDSWFTVTDTATGKVLAESSRLSSCVGADPKFSPDGNWLYLPCLGINEIRFMNANTLQVEATLTIPGAPFAEGPGVPPYTPIDGVPGLMADSALSPDGRWMYVITDEPRLALVNIEQRNIERWIELGGQGYPTVGYGTSALSADGNRLFIGVRTKGKDSRVDEIRIFDTQSWKPIGRLNLDGLPLDGDLSQLSMSRVSNRLMLLLEARSIEKNSLQLHTSFATLDPDRLDAPSPLKLDLSDNDMLVRIVVAP